MHALVRIEQACKEVYQKREQHLSIFLLGSLLASTGEMIFFLTSATLVASMKRESTPYRVRAEV